MRLQDILDCSFSRGDDGCLVPHDGDWVKGPGCSISTSVVIDLLPAFMDSALSLSSLPCSDVPMVG
jgi:hypothetical protein